MMVLLPLFGAWGRDFLVYGVVCGFFKVFECAFNPPPKLN